MKNLNKSFNLSLSTGFIIGVILTFCITSCSTKKYGTTKTAYKGIMAKYKPSDFNSDYQIDLKTDGYLILDQAGDVYYIPFDQLENWFIEDNT